MSLRKILTIIFSLSTLGLLGNLIYVLVVKLSGSQELMRALFSRSVGLAMFYFALSTCILLLLIWGGRLWAKKNLVNLGLLVISVAAAVVLFELVLMPFNLVFDAATTGEFNFDDMQRLAKANPDKRLTIWSKLHWMQKDPELGYMPIMGENYTYSSHGALQNSYPAEKRPGARRVLFVGDSISAFAMLSESLREIDPVPGLEYWVTGVYGYSTWQELKYFQRFGRKLKPEVVILEFCLNDWDGTPVIMKDETGSTIIANLYLGEEQFNYWLFKNSTLYRVYLSLLAAATDRAGLKRDVERLLVRFQEMAKQDGFAFRAVVYPELAKLEDWPQRYRNQRQDILEIMTKLGIKHYDAAPLLDEALKTRPQAWSRLTPDDHFHPSKAFSHMIAQDLIKQGYLD